MGVPGGAAVPAKQHNPMAEVRAFLRGYQDKENGKLIFNSRITHEIAGKRYCTVVEPMFTRVDLKRFTETEWEKHLKKKASALKGYMEQLNREGFIVQLVMVCEDVEDFKAFSVRAVCRKSKDDAAA